MDLILDDAFEVVSVDPDGKKFDKVSRIQAKNDNNNVLLTLDINTELYPVRAGLKFTLVLTKHIAFDSNAVPLEAEEAWRVPSLADKYEYVMYGRVFKFEDISSSKMAVYVSYGGLLMRLEADPRLFQDITIGSGLGPSPVSLEAVSRMGEESVTNLMMGLAPLEEHHTTGYTYDERMLLHRAPEDDDHPEQPNRLQTIIEHFQGAGLLERCSHIQVRDVATNDLLGTVHTPAHLEFMCGLQGQDDNNLLRLGNSMDSLYLCKESDNAARMAVACTVSLARKVAKGELRNGFAIVRPPGHHSEPDKAMGFCLYNNIAVAVRDLQHRKLSKRILILDWDVHHGNGTQKIFADDPDVLFISLHRYDGGNFYPSGALGSPKYVGEGLGVGRSVNIGWDGPGATDSDYMAAFTQVILPMASEFSPDLVMVSAGFDAAEGDTIGMCRVTPRGFARMTQYLMGLAEGKVLLVLEGGYNAPNVATCAEACLRVLLGESIPPEAKTLTAGPSADALAAIMATLTSHRQYWKTLWPRCYDPLDDELSAVAFPLQDVLDTFWRERCRKVHNLIPLPLADEYLQKQFMDRIFASDSLITSPGCIIVFAHEGGPLLSGNLDCNLVNPHLSHALIPFDSYLSEARSRGNSIIDVCLPPLKWRLKQTHTGTQELFAVNELFLHLWDHFLALSEAQDVCFVTSGLPSYALCNLLDKRSIGLKVRRLAIVSPTLYLPVASTEMAEWYKLHSLVLIPTKRPEGTAIATTPSFGNCISSGTEDPDEIFRVIVRSRERIMEFVQETSK